MNGDVVRLFDLFKYTNHTALVFAAHAASADEASSIVTGLPKGVCGVAAVLPRGATTGTSCLPYGSATQDNKHGNQKKTGTATKATYTVTDNEGEAYKAYEISSEPTVVVVRPDGVIGAIVKNTEGIRRYFTSILA